MLLSIGIALYTRILWRCNVVKKVFFVATVLLFLQVSKREFAWLRKFCQGESELGKIILVFISSIKRSQFVC